eukprot:scaffold6355_cov119-Cylindrotheca_fusiformis.AAC.9
MTISRRIVLSVLATSTIVSRPTAVVAFAPSIPFQPRTSVSSRTPSATTPTTPTSRSLSFFSFFALPDASYAVRKASFGLESKEKLAEIAKQDNAVLVDVRSPAEVAEASLTDRDFVRGNFILEQENMETLPDVLPDKDAPIIVFCKMGGRAKKVCDTLAAEGYTNVSNAGGLSDVDFLPEK